MLKKFIEQILNGLMFDEEQGGIGDISFSDEKEDDLDVMQGDEDKDEGEDEEKDENVDDNEDKDENEDEDEKDDDKDDKDEDEEDEEDLDEDLEAVTHASDIKKAYPDFFKKFPDVRGQLYREQEYTGIFGTPATAKEVAARAEVLNRIEEDIMVKGNPIELLKTIESNNKDSYKNVVYAILPHLQETNKELYYELASLPIKQMLRSAWKEGNGSKSDLGKAAAILHKYFFSDYEFDKKSPVEEGGKVAKKSSAEEEYERRLQQLDQRDYNNFKSSVDNSYVTKMDRYIRDTLDKDERLTEYMKKTITNDVLLQIANQLNSDKRYSAGMAELFKQARANSYSNDFKSRIINAALARAKSLVPAIRSKVVSDALGKGKKKEAKEDKGDKRAFKPRERNDRNENRSERREGSRKPLTDMDILRSN